MRISFDEHLKAVLPFAASHFHDSSLFRLAKVSNLFSGSSSNFIFETELGSPKPKVDFSLCILKPEVGELLEHWRKENLQTIIKNNENWKRLFRFCSEWQRLCSPMDKNISDIWFEFDNHQLEKDVPEACLFFSPNKLHKRICGDLSENSLDWLFGALNLIFKEQFPGTMKKNLIMCFEALPGNGGVYQIGIMMPRGFDWVRICTCMPVNTYPAYLEKIGWEGSDAYPHQVLHTLKNYVDAVFVDIDVGNTIRSQIGIECGFSGNRGHIEDKSRLKEFLDYLIEQGLCTRENAESIITWDDYSREQPVDLPMKRRIKRTLSHIKIVLNPGHSLKAKAYLAFSGSCQ